jgi:hypothetical protein
LVLVGVGDGGTGVLVLVGVGDGGTGVFVLVGVGDGGTGVLVLVGVGWQVLKAPDVVLSSQLEPIRRSATIRNEVAPECTLLVSSGPKSTS